MRGLVSKVAACLAFCLMGVVLCLSDVAVAQPQACAPPCRSGYICISGRCVERCNPPCKSGESCTPAGECVVSSSVLRSPPRESPAISRPGRTPAPTPVVTPPATAPEQRLMLLEVATGLVMPHSEYFHIGGHWFGNDAGPILQLSLGFNLHPSFTLGGFFTYVNTGPKEADVSIHLMSFGAEFKMPLRLGNKVQFRFGLGFGFNIIDSDILREATFGINPFALAEFAFSVSERLSIVLGYRFISQPWEKDDLFTFAPVSMLQIGIETNL